MYKVTISIDGNSKGARPTEIISDLRNVAETLYFPMKLSGFWDFRDDIHLCPQEERRQACPHKLPEDNEERIEYAETLQRERKSSIELFFAHAQVSIFLS